MFLKKQVFIVVVFCMLGTWYIFSIFSKFYILFRTYISLPIHCYISLKIIPNIFKVVCYSKILKKNCFGPGWSTVAYYRPERSTGGQPILWSGVMQVSRLTDQSTANPSGRPIGDWLNPTLRLTLVDRAVDRAQWLVHENERPVDRSSDKSHNG